MFETTNAISDRDELLDEIKQDIEAVIENINSFEKIRLLGSLASALSDGVKHTRPALPNIIETSLEYALSIALATDNNPELPMPSAEDMLRTLHRLEVIREKYIKYALTEDNPRQYTALEQNLRSRVIEKTLTVRGEGYRGHVEEIFLELFDEHIDFFEKHMDLIQKPFWMQLTILKMALRSTNSLLKRSIKSFSIGSRIKIPED